MNRQSDFVSEYRQQITNALLSISQLRTLHTEAALMQYPGSMNAEEVFIGANSDVELEKLAAAMSAASSLLADISPEELAALYKVRV